MSARPAALVAALALLSACATGPYRPLPGPQPGPRTDPSLPAPGPGPVMQPGPDTAPGRADGGAGPSLPEPAPSPVAGATGALLGQSREQRSSGDYGGAAATVERALAISPDAAALWVELAEIRFEQGEFDLAEEMARKALTLTTSGSAEAERARRLIGR